MRERFRDLVEASDLHALLREVDALCERRDWESLLLLRRMCEEAVDRGKQLWPISEHIVFRLVLEGPGEIAGPLVVPSAGRFAPGPLAEVAASTHSFAELADHLPSPQVRESVAAERVLRGENLSFEPRAHPPVLELPLELLDWEPPYRLAVYRRDHVEVQEPVLPSLSALDGITAGAIVTDEDLEEALLDLVRPWFEESGGRAETVVVDGGPLEAVASLGIGEVRSAEIGFPEALELMGWAAASGGVHGRRRGAAFGRFSAWWASAQMCELSWPPDPQVLQSEGSELAWIAFEPAAAEKSGWRLGIACGSEEDGWACALYASDTPEQAGEREGNHVSNGLKH